MKFIHLSLFMFFIFCTLIHVTLFAGNGPILKGQNLNIHAEKNNTNETLTHSTESESDDCTIEDKGPDYRAYICENGEESYLEPDGTLDYFLTDYCTPYDTKQKNLSYGLYKNCRIENKNFNNKNLSHSTFKSCTLSFSDFENTI